MTFVEFRAKFLDFFEKQGRKIVPSSSLLSSDKSVLFTTAGMQQFKEYFIGKKSATKDFGNTRVTSCQKCFRSDDIEEVGDSTHHTFFEMLGNFSFNDYSKKQAIKFAWEFLSQELKLNKEQLYVTIFKGNSFIPKDEEAKMIWQNDIGLKPEKIREFGEKDNFWGPVSDTGVCGPCSEIHYDRGEKFSKKKCSKKGCGPNCECGRFVEIWNLVFLEYNKNEQKKFDMLEQKNIDTGMGFERVLAIIQNKESAYETDLFFQIIQQIENESSDSYRLNPKPFRIIADHIRATCFLIAQGVVPSNVEHGYILRRVLRRAIRYVKILNIQSDCLVCLSKEVVKIYGESYPELKSKQDDILSIIKKEQEKFAVALKKGIKKFEKLLKRKIENKEAKFIDGEAVFDLYQSYGFPFEFTKELATEKGFKIDAKDFRRAMRKHQKISNAGAKKKFGGHGIEKSELKFANTKIAKLHTATHLLHSALRNVLGNEVRQMGSNINEERLRFDFSFYRKLTDEEKLEIENLVNEKIKENLEVKERTMSYEEAKKAGALAFFKEKYPKQVSVYCIGDFSKEICAGPHIKNTKELGEFKIIKEQSSSSGVRRIKAIVL
ncbi:MAG: alanine--tRNA ligase [Patescibacteria group bacterium]|nr:alanine--tRNA ligase [Patescibacteria group bacterium]